MDWTRFNTHGESCNRAFEVMCNLLFEAWCRKEYGDQVEHIVFINGEGGDGGVEAFTKHKAQGIVGIQTKWFRNKIEANQIGQIEGSFLTAIRVRPSLVRYIVCVPRDLGNKRTVKGGAVAKNTEMDRWEKLKEKLLKEYPTVTLDLWDETRIQEMLTWPELQGVYKYWFDNTELFDSQFELSFEKAKQSWAKAKYVPDLYAEGNVHQALELFLGSYKLSELRFVKMCNMVKRLVDLKRAYGELLSLGFPDSEKEIEEEINADVASLDTWISLFDDKLDYVKRGGTVGIDPPFSLKCCEESLKKSSFHYDKYFHCRTVEKMLVGLEDDFYLVSELISNNSDNKRIIIGDPGSGKTTGIVSEIAQWFANRMHLPILVQARDFGGNDTWITIIEKTLGLSADWNENELFLALQSAALITSKKKNDEYDIEPNCVICVDGIDESSSWEFWKRKIEEVAAYRDIFPRVKFVFLSRPYVFSEWYKLDYRSSFVYLKSTGDVSPEELCDIYFDKYRITLGDNQWIRRLLKTPLAVRLFCDVYQGREIRSQNCNTAVITCLFREKIEQLNERFATAQNGKERCTISSVLCEIAEQFVQKEKVTYEEVRDRVASQYRDSLKEALSFLENEGFIYSFSRRKDEFSAETIYYSWGMQPALDYLIARKVFEALENGMQISTAYHQGVYQMLSLILLEEKGKLLFECDNIFLDDDSIFDMVCYALANASTSAVKSYQDYAIKLMKYSVEQFRTIVKRVVVPVCGVDQHPLGAKLLDDFLRSFDNPAERDIWWSIPSCLRVDHDEDWMAYTEIPFDEITLGTDETAFSRPLFVAWSLSNVRTEVRQNSQAKLLEWGLKNQAEFLTLLFYMADVNDNQILEDIFSVAYGISLSQEVSDTYLISISTWIMENVFSVTGLNRYENAVIRYYCSGMVHISIKRGLNTVSLKAVVMPPYEYKTSIKQIAVEAANAERMGGYKAIQYDLARYVLCDHLDVFFKERVQQKACTKDGVSFIQKYKEHYGLSKLKSDGLILSLAYQFLKDSGWNESVFLTDRSNGSAGVDSSILLTYYPASHGARSPIMSVAEKYVWLARHHIECILANEVVFKEMKTSSGESYITDYSQLEDFSNPYQNYISKLYHNKEERWFHLELLADIHHKDIDKTVIEEWMKEEEVPDFRAWLTEYENATLIYTFTNRQNTQTGIEETLWVSSGVVKNPDFPGFLECLDKYPNEKYEFTNVAYYHSSQSCNCYCTPQEVCLVYPEKETDASLFLNESAIETKKLVQECLYAGTMNCEETFWLPSRFIREMMKISYGDGYKYYDKTGRTVAEYYCNGENWETQQKILLIDRGAFVKKLNEEGFKPFWLFRVYRSPSNKAYEKYPDIMHDTDVTFLVWMEDDVKYKVLQRTKS